MILLLACVTDQPATPPTAPITPTPTTEAPVTAKVSRPKLDCEAPPKMEAPKACISGELHCGDEVVGTTVGGDSTFDNDEYARFFCFPRTQGGHDGPERVYRLSVPERTEATVELTSPCADLDVAAIAFDYQGRCPDADYALSECEGDPRTGDGKVRLQVFSPRDYLVVVDGKTGQTGAYRLEVSCRALREDR